jgi:integrase
MGVTINLVQLKRKQRKNGEIPIYIRFTEGKKSRYKSTGLSVLPKEWDPDNQRVRKSHKFSSDFNFELKKQLNEIERKELNLRKEGKLSVHRIKEELTEQPRDSVKSFTDVYLSKLSNDQRYWEHKHFKVLKGNLESFLDHIGKPDLKLDKVDVLILERFQRYLASKEGPGNSPNTIRKKIQRFRGMLQEAKKRKLINHDPFFGFEKVKAETPQKTKLSPGQINDIEALELEKGSALWHVRNYFLFSYYNAGIRFGDLCTLKWENIVDGRLKYRMNKTGSGKNIKQLRPMLDILEQYRSGVTIPEDYIFPILEKEYEDEFELKRVISSKNVIVNRVLKDLAEMADIEETVSFHVSRHSWANLALKRGKDLYTISKALGHSGLEITEQYLKAFDEEKLDEDMEDLYQ